MKELILAMHAAGKSPKKIALEMLRAAKLRQNEEREHPLPMHALAPPKFKTSDANGLSAAIVAFLDAIGGWASRVNTMGVYDAKRKAYRKTTMKLGFPDVQATYRGRSIYVEVKIGKDRLSPNQKKFIKGASEAGALVIVARTFEDFFNGFLPLLE